MIYPLPLGMTPEEVDEILGISDDDQMDEATMEAARVAKEAFTKDPVSYMINVVEERERRLKKLVETKAPDQMIDFARESLEEGRKTLCNILYKEADTK